MSFGYAPLLAGLVLTLVFLRLARRWRAGHPGRRELPEWLRLLSTAAGALIGGGLMLLLGPEMMR